MPLTKLTVRRTSERYSVQDGVDVVATKLDGGASRYRLDQIGSTSTVTVQWQVKSLSYEYLRAFFNTVSARGSLPFLIDLTMDKSVCSEHTAYFIPGSMRLEKGGTRFVVSVDLEVIRIDHDTDYDTAIVMLYNEYGEDYFDPLNLLEQLVNVDIPGDNW